MEKKQKNLLKNGLIAFSVLTIIGGGVLAVSASEEIGSRGFMGFKGSGERPNPEDCPLLNNLSDDEKALKIAEIEAHRAEMTAKREERRTLREANGLKMGQVDENGAPLHRGFGRGQMRNISQ